MAENSYTQTTIFDNFQALGFGDRIWPDVELENWQKVENKLLAINYVNFAKQTGAWTQLYINSTSSAVRLNVSGIVPAFEGSINGSYFKISDTLTWSLDTTTTQTLYLYLTEVQGQIDPTDPLSVDKEVSSVRYTSTAERKTRLLLAIVEVTGGVGIASINTDPEGTEIESDYIYDTQITTGTDLELDMRTILGLGIEEEPEVKFVGISAMGDIGYLFSTSVSYDVDGESWKFTIHSVGTDNYDLPFEMDIRLMIRYSL